MPGIEPLPAIEQTCHPLQPLPKICARTQNSPTKPDVDTADPSEAFAIWHEECARSRGIVDAAQSPDTTGRYRDDVFSLRYILTHMIEEYARHNDHADLLRQRIDKFAEQQWTAGAGPLTGAVDGPRGCGAPKARRRPARSALRPAGTSRSA
ncbi:DUF664 domain-containing protein [Streptomyces camelliae]|uniref:DUF664 domain-containing protein n=1 Tax=Streptomyces camelliae TaxID=3004093 RepID=A0ABY7PFP9_9ACTN|nr:DUF664 domain-containing protein [Streptomyces sp. HUAS 2-6]WBO69000.1 DUF664 domain-containing protein [Streptomyces sp. HUAS 2-6]